MYGSLYVSLDGVVITYVIIYILNFSGVIEVMLLSFNGQVIKPKLARPGRVPVTTCAWDRDGKCIAGGIGDGSIQVLIFCH